MRDYGGADHTEESRSNTLSHFPRITQFVTLAMSVMVFALSINFLWSILTFLNLTHCDITVQKILLKVNSRVDGEEELPLVSPDPGVSDPLDQLGVLVDQPGLPQHVGGRVLQLKHNQGNIRVRRNFFKENFLGKVLFGILHVPCSCDT